MQAVNPMLEIADAVTEYGGETMHVCMQCGTCTSVCPWNLVSPFSPRLILRQISLGKNYFESLRRKLAGDV